jgi:hypothetical protein
MITRLAVIAALLSTTAAHAQIDASELPARLAKISAGHPRLFFDAEQTSAVKAKIAADPLLQGTFGYILANCEIVKGLEPLERKQVGKRLLGVSRTVLQRVSYLAFAYRMTGDESLLRRAEAEMLSAAAFTDWNPSHFLDVAEMTAALAIGYDWLHAHLAPEARATIRDAIIEKGLKTSLTNGWWVTTSNNWNQVCHGGLILGALAVAEDVPGLAEEILARGLKNLPRALHEYEPDGIYPEGPTYWAYGTSYNVILIDALESVLGTDFGITTAEGLMKSPDFMLHATSPTGLYFNFADCGLLMDVEPALHWFARKLAKPSLLWHQRAVLERFVETKPDQSGEADRMLVFLLLWGEPMGDIDTPEQLHWQGEGPSPIGVHRSAWHADATYAGIKGGSPRTNHGHMDIGSFVAEMEGVRWAVDLGAQSYNSLESEGVDLWNRHQDGGRWSVFRLNNTSHNTLVVNGEHQRVEGHAPITGFSGAPESPYTAVDMTPVYAGQLAKAHRVLRLIGEAVLIHDEIAAPENAEAHVRWGMVTHADVSIEGNTATLKQDGKTATLRVAAPQDATLSVIDLESPPQPYDAKNPNTRMVAFEVTLPPGGGESLTVLLAPGEDFDEAPWATLLLELVAP